VTVSITRQHGPLTWAVNSGSGNRALFVVVISKVTESEEYLPERLIVELLSVEIVLGATTVTAAHPSDRLLMLSQQLNLPCRVNQMPG